MGRHVFGVFSKTTQENAIKIATIEVPKDDGQKDIANSNFMTVAFVDFSLFIKE